MSTLAAPRAARYRAELAAPADDAEVRRLLREAEMDGAVRVALACEPDARRAAAIEGPEHQRVVLRDRAGGIAAIGGRSVRERFVDGGTTRVGYYGQLRIDGARATLVRPGFAAMRELHERDGRTRLYFASVVRGNEVAQRLLRAGLRGLPGCLPAGSLVTLLAPAARSARTKTLTGLRLERGRPELLDELVACLGRNLRRFQLAPRWTAADLLDDERCRDLALEHFRVATRNGRVVGCAALWDQRAYKQSIVRGYSPALGRLRPAWNLWARAVNAPPLPAPGDSLSMAFLSHLAVDEDDPRVARALFDGLRADARARRIGLVTVGLGARHPLLPALARRGRAWRYESDLLYMPWPEDLDAARALAARPLQPEVAVL